MLLNYYFRKPDKSLGLCQVKGEMVNAGIVKDGLDLVMKHLYETRETFLDPILCVIQGGKQ